ncbi:hypothetical protein [Jongsikchunia kroppenstedtii]|uniref:hypothetical protein n=1 Tax=Jongsikchunia kroppenstedtii TaxID=1121721 RepID=UPI0003A33C10|nr:hypothetical protein [Jongsikchunia kroppenstedtii]
MGNPDDPNPQPFPGGQQPGGQQPAGAYPDQPWPGQQPWAGQQPYPGQPPLPGQPFPSQQFPAVPPQQPGYPAGGFGGPPPGMPPAPGGYPGYPPNQPPPDGKTKWLIGAGVAVVVIVVAAVVGMWAGGVFGSDGDGKPMPSAKARELVIGQSEFPTVSDGRFRISSSDPSSATSSRHRTDEDIKESYDPSECEAIGQPGRSQADTADQASAVLTDQSGDSDSPTTYRAAVEKATDPIFADFDKLLTTCRTFTNTMSINLSGRTSTYSYQMTTKRLSASGVDGDYLGIEVTSKESDSGATYHARMLFGTARGMSFMVGSSGKSLEPSVNADLVKMFNAQREKINQAA